MARFPVVAFDIDSFVLLDVRAVRQPSASDWLPAELRRLSPRCHHSAREAARVGSRGQTTTARMVAFVPNRTSAFRGLRARAAFTAAMNSLAVPAWRLA